MKWLIIAVLVLAQQPMKVPESRGTAKSDNANSTRTAKPAQTDQTTPTQPAPALPQASAGPETKGIPNAHDGKTPTNSQQTDDENRATQRKLVWFTGVLAVVGFLQFVVMLLQWRIYVRQAREMRRSRHEMRRQRHVMYGQYKAMRSQIAQMEEAGKQTAELIKHASTQSGLMALAGTHTEQLANQAVAQTKLTQSQLELSQRPWVSVVRIPQQLQFAPDAVFLGCVYKLENRGASVAWNVSIWAELVPTEKDWRPILQKLQNVMKDPVNASSDYGYVLFPSEIEQKYQPAMLTRVDLDASIRNDTFKGTGKVGFYLVGCIDYRSHASLHHYQTSFVDLVGYPDNARGGVVMGAFDPTQKIYMPVILTPHGHGASAT
jgi:hypothetical protein